MRLFCAVWLPERVRESLARFQHDFLTAKGVKLVSESNLHVTILFFGDVEGRDVKDYASALERAACEATPFSMELSGIGVFPTPARPRVIWAGVADGASSLGLIHERVSAAIRGLGHKPEGPFHPHVTLGRVKSYDSQCIDTLQSLLSPTSPGFGAVAVQDISLVESSLGPAGPTYRVIGAFPLGKP